MSMHLEGPWLTTTGKKKGKKKFRNAEAAKKSRELAEAWGDLLNRHNIKVEKRKQSFEPLRLHPSPYRRETPKIESLPFTGGPCVKSPEKTYTGDKIIGIGTMHKSNAVPIFSAEDAESISKMRR